MTVAVPQFEGTLVIWSDRLKDLAKSGLVLLALAAAVLLVVGAFTLLRHRSCDRLNAERLLHLEPGHNTPGPGSIYVVGVGHGPPRSQIIEYIEAEAAMERAGCDW
jgi:hypothetical protein